MHGGLNLTGLLLVVIIGLIFGWVWALVALVALLLITSSSE